MAWAALSSANLISIFFLAFMFFMHEPGWGTVAVAIIGALVIQILEITRAVVYRELGAYYQNKKEDAVTCMILAAFLFLCFYFELNFKISGNTWDGARFFALMMVFGVMGAVSGFLVFMIYMIKKFY